MQNAVQSGDVVTLTAPYDVASGAGAKVGSVFGVAVKTVANGAQGEFAVTGVFDLKTASADTPAQGAAAYWDDSAKQVTATVGTNLKIGVFLVAKGAGETTGRVRLNGAF